MTAPKTCLRLLLITTTVLFLQACRAESPDVNRIATTEPVATESMAPKPTPTEVESAQSLPTPPAAENAPVTLLDTETHVLQLPGTKRAFKIFVALPPGYADSGKTYPVLYALDANGQFGTVTETTRDLGGMQELPELIVVGIGYPTDVKATIMDTRILDFTPTTVVSTDPGTYSFPMSGGARRFLEFVREELMPFVQSTYRVDPNDATISGHSAGGLFVFYALFEHPDMFNRYLASSPALWWDNGVIFEYESKFAAQHDDLPAHVFVSAGAYESTSDPLEMARTLQDRGYASLHLTTHVFDDETHMSVFPAAISRGLRVVYEKMP